MIMDLTFELIKKDKVIKFEIFDARTLLIEKTLLRYRINEDCKWELFIEGIWSLKENDSINFVLNGQSMSYKIISVEEQNEYYILRTHKRSKTTMIVLPMLGGTYSDYAYDKFFINAYIENDKINLLYRFVNSDEYREFEDKIRNNKYYLKTIDPSNDFVVYVMTIPNSIQIMHDIGKFKEGKYSKINEATKKKILEFHKLDKNSELFHILYKSNLRRMAMSKALGEELDEHSELWDIVDLEQEKLVI